MPKASSRLSTEVCSFLQKEIRKTGGDEVFVVGNINADGIVSQASVASKSLLASLKNGAVAIHAAKDNAKALICNHPSGILRSSGTELAIVLQAKSSGLGFYIVNNSVTEVCIAVEPMLAAKKKPIEPAPKIESKPETKIESEPKPKFVNNVDSAHVAHILSKDGALSRILPNFKERPKQLKLANACTLAFNEGKVAVFEAGAGVDKSLDYLIPATLWSIKNKQRVVVSTATIEQQQLMQKDIPDVREAIGRDFKVALVRGSSNCICRRRLDAALRYGDFFAEDEESLKAIAQWAKTASAGSRDSLPFSRLPFSPSDDLWSSVCCERTGCPGKNCPHYSVCFFMAEREKAETASVLVASHQLLFADIKARYSGEGYQATAVLPPYSIIVFDEAHTIESVAKSAFSAFASPRGILRRLNHFVSDKNWKADGMLDILEEMTVAKDAALRARASAPSARDALAAFEQRLDFKLSLGTAFSPAAAKLFKQAETLCRHLSFFCSNMGSVFEGIKEENDLAATLESWAVLDQLNKDVDFLKSFLSWDKMSKPVYGIERKFFHRMGKQAALTEVSLYRESASIPMTMKAAVFDQFHSVVCILDALRVNGSFNDWMRRSGASLVEKGRLIAGVYSSPAPSSKPPAATARSSPPPSRATLARSSSTATKAQSVAPAPASPAPSSAQVTRPSPPHSSSAATARPSSAAAKAQPAAPPRPVPPPQPASAQLPQFGNFPQYVAYLLSKDGPLARIFPDYEERPEQMKLASNIAAAFEGGKVAMFEAGTGIGKSLAYLIPAVLWSLEKKQRVVVATATINLQDQLIDKDIQDVRKVIGKPFKAVLVKGRDNYLCRRRLRSALQNRNLSSEDKETLERIDKWSKTTSEGSRSELSPSPPDELWERVSSDSDTCAGNLCPHHASCFVEAMRKRAEGTSILVANHHILFADIELRYSTLGYEATAALPPYNLIVFDEAHAIEKSATSFFSSSLTPSGLLQRINHFVPDAYQSGFAQLDLIEEKTANKDAAKKARAAIPDLKQEIEGLKKEALATCGSSTEVRISPKTAKEFFGVPKVLSQAEAVYEHLSSFCDNMGAVFEGIQTDVLSTWESRVVHRKLKKDADFLKGFLSWDKDANSVYWIEKCTVQQGKPYPQLNRAPISVAEKMQDAVFDWFHSVVCVSATLQVNNDKFSFWAKRSGVNYLDASRLASDMHPSPFPYDTRVLLALPDDIPPPKKDDPAFQAVIERRIPEFIEASSGASLVLFTSYASMESCYKAAHVLLEQKGLSIHCQGEDDRARLLEEFKEDTSSVLFGVDSFWEGIDAAGETLRHVIIVKLPFTHPFDPVFEARCERIKNQGGDPFNELSVPEAVIKFRQGFGRLMRRMTDRGVVTVLDSRIIVRDYRNSFLDSIPKTQVTQGSSQAVLQQIKSFFR